MRFKVFCVVLSLAALVGCGSSGPFDYVPVSGRVTYQDGTPIPGSFRLIFYAQGVAPVGNARPRPARAVVNEQGEFDCVTSHKYGDGLIPGKHKVVVQIGDLKGKPLVPGQYSSSETTPLVIDTADAPLEIKLPKP